MIRRVEILTSSRNQIDIVEFSMFDTGKRYRAAMILNALSKQPDKMAQTLTFEFDSVSISSAEGIADQVEFLELSAALVELVSTYATSRSYPGIYSAIPSWKFELV